MGRVCTHDKPPVHQVSNTPLLGIDAQLSAIGFSRRPYVMSNLFCWSSASSFTDTVQMQWVLSDLCSLANRAAIHNTKASAVPNEIGPDVERRPHIVAKKIISVSMHSHALEIVLHNLWETKRHGKLPILMF